MVVGKILILIKHNFIKILNFKKIKKIKLFRQIIKKITKKLFLKIWQGCKSWNCVITKINVLFEKLFANNFNFFKLIIPQIDKLLIKLLKNLYIKHTKNI